MSWFSSLFSSKKSTSAPHAGPEGFGPAAASLPDSGVQQARELIQRTVYELIHALGLPQSWFKLEIVTLTLNQQAQFQLQITLMQWEPYLLMHMQAFERAITQSLRNKDPSVNAALRAVLWQLGDTAGCPFQQLPGSHAWTPMAIAKRRSHLDAALQQSSLPSAVASGFDPAAAAQTTDAAFSSTLQTPLAGRHASPIAQDDFADTMQVGDGSREAAEAMRRLDEARRKRAAAQAKGNVSA